MQEYGLYLSVGTILALIAALWSIARKFTRLESDVENGQEIRDNDKREREMLEAKIENLSRDVNALDRDSVARLDSLRLETGEMGAALRQKIHEVEISSRDRIDVMSASIRESIEKLGERLELKIERSMQRRD